MINVLLLVLLAGNINMQGEQNVQREIPHAIKIFGKKSKKDYASFYFKSKNFEKPYGFQSEAEMEAAKRVLKIK